MVPVNESARKLLNPSGAYSFQASMIAGFIAGAVAATVTNPLDVVKTRLQTRDLLPCPTPQAVEILLSNLQPNSLQEQAPHQSKHSLDYLKENHNSGQSHFGNTNPIPSTARGTVRMSELIRQIIREEGYIAFARGMLPRILVQAPSIAISWTAYESMKTLLGSVGAKRTSHE